MSDSDDEPCIVFEKLAPPVITQPSLITAPVISQKKAEAIKRDVRNKMFGVTENSKFSSTVSNTVKRVGHGDLRQSPGRKKRSSFSTTCKAINRKTLVANVIKVEAEPHRLNENTMLAKIEANKKSCNIENAHPNAVPIVNEIGYTDCRTSGKVCGSSNSSTSSCIATTSSDVVPTPSNSCQSCLPSTSQAVTRNPVSPVSNSKFTLSCDTRKCDVNSTDVKGNTTNTVSSTSDSCARQLSNGKMSEMLRNSSQCTRTGTNAIVENASVTCLPQVSQSKCEVLTNSTLPADTSSSSSTRNENELLQSKLELINRCGTEVIPVSPSKLCKPPVCNGRNKQLGEDILKDPIVNQSSSPLNVTVNLVPTISLKQEAVQQPVADDLNHVHSSQKSVTAATVRQPTETNATAVEANNIDTGKKQLSPHLKAHPWKFLNPSPGSSRKATSSTPRKKSSFKRSPGNYCGRRNLRVAVNSPAKASVKKTLNFDVKGDDGSGIGDVSVTSGSTTLDEIYCKHFKIMLLSVMQSYSLFSVEEVEIIKNFINLSSLAKMLYIRMFSRKFCWHRSYEIYYQAIGANLVPVIEELDFRDLVTVDYSGEDLRTLLGLLKATELKQLCQNLNVTVSATTKEGRIEELLQYGRNQQTISPVHNYNDVIRRETKKILGECFKLCESPRHLFQRILLVYSLSQRKTGPVEVLPQLLMMHDVEIGKIKFPQYPLSDNMLFMCRDEVVSFHDADDLCNELQDAIQGKNLQQIRIISSEAEVRFRLLIDNVDERARASNLPLFLRRFFACSKYAYTLDIAVEILRKEKVTHRKAIEILEMLLEQDMFLTHYRGFWYDKLALIHHYHEKNLKKAADVIIQAMSDCHVTDVQKYNLVIRGHRIHSAKNGNLSKKQKRDLYFSLDDYKDDPPSITISAKVLPNQGPGRKKVYVEFDAENQQTTYSSVEEYAISYYKKQGYTCGYHTEGSIVSSLFALIFWDILYEIPVPGVFLGQYQEAPLDLNYPEFYASRSVAIDKKLQEMENMTIEELQAIVTEMHTKHAGTLSLVNWNLLPDVKRATVLVACLGTRLLARICERLAKKHRMARSGFPDLLVWSASERKCKIVEVKGPNDHLSGSQVLWLNYLIEAGADAEVCHVQHTGSKSAKRKSTEIEDI